MFKVVMLSGVMMTMSKVGCCRHYANFGGDVVHHRADKAKESRVSQVSVFTISFSVLLSIALSTAVNWFLGPLLTLRQERAKHGRELRREILATIKQLRLHLCNEELRRQALQRGEAATMRFTITDYERMLWPAVIAFDDPDLDRRLAQQLRDGFRALLGSWRLEYLSICDTKDLENALQRYSEQPLEPRHVEEPMALIPAMCGRMGETALATQAIVRVNELITLLAERV